MNLKELFENSKLVQNELKQDRDIIVSEILKKDDHIHFKGISTGDDDKEYNLELQLYETEFPIDIEKCDAKVSCSCPSFRFRNERYLNEVNALADNHELKEYEKKTDRKPMNPDQLPSVCKHIYQFALKLQEVGNLVNV